MRKLLLGITAFGIIAAVSCKPKPTDPDPVTPVTPSEDTLGYKLSGEITANRSLLAGKTYTIESMVYVKNGATLTIGKGCTIKGIKGKNALVITRGAKIMAEGTVDSPIVFTSNEASPAPGDWGGIVILGRATTNAVYNGNAGTGEIEGGVNTTAGDGLYGGTDDNDNSGVLKYVRIEYGGYPFQPNQELNSLTMGAVGAGTTIDYVQCSYGYDDAFEWFGGTVNCKHLIAYKTHDDMFDGDFGFRGNLQFGLGISNPADADISGSNGFEIDNDATGSDNNPKTAPTFANFTIIGPKQTSTSSAHNDFKRAAHLRRNSRAAILNSVVVGFPTGILIDGNKCANNILAEDLQVRGVVVSSASSNKNFDTAGNISVAALTASGSITTYMTTANASWNNVKLGTGADEAGFAAPYAAGNSFSPNPTAGSLLNTGVITSSRLGSWFTVTTYRGACSTTDTWWQGWTKFN